MKQLKARCEATSITATAAEIGVSRTAVSLVLAGKYPGKTDKMAERVMDNLGRVHCPYTGEMVKPSFCAEVGGENIPTSSPGALRWWRCCQTCEHNKAQRDGIMAGEQ